MKNHAYILKILEAGKVSRETLEGYVAELVFRLEQQLDVRIKQRKARRWLNSQLAGLEHHIVGLQKISLEAEKASGKSLTRLTFLEHHVIDLNDRINAAAKEAFMDGKARGRNEGIEEGLVARPAVELKARDGSRIITKIKVKDFKQVKSMTNWKQRALYALMSEISEECYYAGWMNGTEYVLWDMVSDPAAKWNYSQGGVQQWQIDDLRTISAEIGGWIRWRDDSDGAALEDWGPVFTPMAEWLKMYEARAKP